MIQLETDRLRFRQWNNNDFETIAQFYSREETAKYVGGVKSRVEAWRLMACYIGHYTIYGYSYPALEEKSTGNLIGSLGLWNSPVWPEPELGYWLLPEYQGKGFGTEAGLLVRDYALHELNFESLVSYIDPTNDPSKKLALRLGAKLDGVMDLLDYGPHEVYRYR